MVVLRAREESTRGAAQSGCVMYWSSLALVASSDSELDVATLGVDVPTLIKSGDSHHFSREKESKETAEYLFSEVETLDKEYTRAASKNA